MTHRRRRANISEEPSLAGQLMGLSLFIMLLAFFIVLNAISTPSEKKYRPALASLEGAFGSQLDGSDNRPSVTRSDQKSIYEGDSLEKMQALFSAHIAGVEINKEDYFGTMHARMPFARLMDAVSELEGGQIADSDLVAAQDQFFLPTLISLMQTETQPKQYRMDIILNLPEDPARLQNDNPGALKEPLARLADLAESLENAGLKASYLSIGLAGGQEGMADLYFRPFTRFTAFEKEKRDFSAETNEQLPDDAIEERPSALQEDRAADDDAASDTETPE